MSLNKKEIERLLALKKRQEELQVLNQLEMQEKMKLELKSEMDSIQMQPALQEAEVSSNDLDLILADYTKRYSQESWYKKPKVENGKATLFFPTEDELADFCKDQAHLNRMFIVVDKETQKVLAYSNGDGQLYNGNGTEYTGGNFEPSVEDFDDFRMQKHNQSLRMTP